MIVIDKVDIGENTVDRFTLIEDGFFKGKGDNSGFVQMDIRPSSEGESEGIEISFTDNIMDKTGDYLPLWLDIDGIDSLINFLNICKEKAILTTPKD